VVAKLDWWVYEGSMSITRKRRRASERKIAKLSKRTPITIWTIIFIVLVGLAVGLARTLR